MGRVVQASVLLYGHHGGKRSCRAGCWLCGLSVLLLPMFVAPRAYAQNDALSAARLATIRDAALQSKYALRETFILANQIGPRLPGSVQAAAAARQIADAMGTLDLKVQTIPAPVPQWQRGTADAAVVEYAGRPAGVEQPLDIAALGNSPATPQAGITAPILMVRSYDELQANAKQAAGRIVVFDVPFDRQLAASGYATTAYERVAHYRMHGPAMAAQLGAVAALVRSSGGAHYRLVHTGMTVWDGVDHPIPAASVTGEDADLLESLAVRGPVQIHLDLRPISGPTVQEDTVVGDLPGIERPDEIVIVSGHYDSWDLGTGAQDNASGVAAAMGVAAVFHQLRLKPKRTVRIVAWANEENGLTGASAYRAAMARSLDRHVGAIENDTGTGRPFGIAANITPESAAQLAPVFEALSTIDASFLVRSAQPVAADIGLLTAAGVPGFAPLVDMSHYFDIHHTAADTFDKVDSDNLRRQVAIQAVLAWWLANADPLPRLPATAADQPPLSGE
ncbi:MAG: M20/M25/M40 family metallo-hydrolase [Nevskiaceae bacterium]|nr:MAG: M20/M25/M40 family metallo-hydrolase [Nevskiaceae bacterium]TBR71757.1 MAG: M20/M25/M40 family metallo-hydrolase [Nevskiaceae bacterium]